MPMFQDYPTDWREFFSSNNFFIPPPIKAISPGVHVLRDLRTNVYNFDPFLEKIVQPEDFNFDCLPPFIPPFKDSALHSLAVEKGAKFVSSTSSISATMSQIYYLISNMRELNLQHLSSVFTEESKKFTMINRAPTAVILRPHGDGVRSIVTEKIDSAENVLSQLGQSLEKLLTLDKAEFKRLLKDASNPLRIDDLDGYAHTLVASIIL